MLGVSGRKDVPGRDRTSNGGWGHPHHQPAHLQERDLLQPQLIDSKELSYIDIPTSVGLHLYKENHEQRCKKKQGRILVHATYFTLGSLKINMGKVITTKITIHRNLDPQPHRKITIPAHPISTCCKKNHHHLLVKHLHSAR